MSSTTSNASSTPATPRHRRRKTAENWDDDFEFALPSRSSKKAVTQNVAVVPGKGDSKGRISPEITFEPSWDESPPGPSRPTIRHRQSSAGSRLPAPISIPHPPRSSSSQTASLPSSSSGDKHIQPSPSWTISTSSSSISSRPYLKEDVDDKTPRSKSRPPNTSRNKLLKRHPSSSFVSLPPLQPDQQPPLPPLLPTRSSSSLSSYNTSPHPMPRSHSGEQMPPPPLPSLTTRQRSDSKGKARATPNKDEVRVSRIPFSPSSEQIAAAENRRPSLWKRLSGAPSPKPNKNDENDLSRRRRRSSSVNGRPPSGSASPRPPVPPLPSNLRSPSTNSTTSNISASSSNRSASTTISAILRRSASSLSRRSDHSSPPPSFNPYFGSNSRSSSTSKHSVPPTPPLPVTLPFSAIPPPTPPSSYSFSRGFHLPSPSPGSPYHSPPIPPPIPHSASYTAPTYDRSMVNDNDTDTDTEQEGKTPRRRRKIRPVSALPAPRMSNGGWNGDGWRGFSGQGIASNDKPHESQAMNRSASDQTSSSSPRSPNLASTAASAFRRLGSISKSHGRRLSGGMMFNGTALGSQTEVGKTSFALEPVVGSPSRTGKVENGHLKDSEDRGIRGSSISAPSSSFKDPPIASGGMASSMSEDIIAKKLDKQRRRQSWNDFVIPRSVLDKQKGLKANIGAVKLFAGGLENLKSLQETHDQLLKQVEQTTSGSSDLTSALFSLEDEFRQWWEMASVLIEVGNTNTDSNRISSESSRPTSPHSRRITLATDQAKATADALRSVSAISPGSPPIEVFAPRNLSLPEHITSSVSPVSALMSPPRASPEHWRGSTGRQDLSRRQLEVLRTMLRTPVSDRPVASRQASTVSASSSHANVRPPVSATVSPAVAATATMRHVSRSTTDSSNGVRLPSPPDSAYIVPSSSFPSPGTAISLANPKRNSKAVGLAGLKDFLKSLKTTKGQHTERDEGATPKANGGSRKSVIKPSRIPIPSPNIPATRLFESSSPSDSKSPINSTKAQQHEASEGGPRRDGKRPSLRNIFRSSSGNWSDLVRGERRSIDGGRDDVNTTSGRNSPSAGSGFRKNSPGLPRLPSRANLSRSNSKKSSKTPKSPGRRKSAQRSATSLVSPQDYSSGFDKGTEGTNTPSKNIDDRTLRPRKSRVIGLGWPEPDRTAMSSNLTMDETRASSDPLDHDTAARRQSRSTTNSSWASTSSFNDGDIKRQATDIIDNNNYYRSGFEDEEMETVVLTPENLPVLLEYLKTCEKMLGEWKQRVRNMGLIVG